MTDEREEALNHFSDDELYDCPDCNGLFKFNELTLCNIKKDELFLCKECVEIRKNKRKVVKK